MSKRKHESTQNVDISNDFLSQCEKDFKANPVNIIARNAVASVGSLFSTINSNRVNKLNYIFMNTVKKKNLKATNQGHSGRCWMFAALNTFRHILIKTLELDNFEFSETYLFFYDKLERCNSYLRWFMDNPNQTPDDKGYEYMITQYMGDGGWFSTFANLVNKYGLVPKDCMNETASSSDSDDMNQILKEHIDSAVNYMRKKKLSNEQKENIRQQTMKQVYNTLVKFLGEPPITFDWSFSTEEDSGNIISSITPKEFLQMVAPNINMIKDFVCLANVPTEDLKMNTNYVINCTNNVYEGERVTFYNTSSEEMSKYVVKSIMNGFAVWFVADVSQGFNWFHSALDDELDDHKTVFGDFEYKFSKGDRIKMRNIQGNHAMAIVGFNLDHNENVINFCVENSWGYSDNEIPGMDGFLTMSYSWFKKYVTHIVIHRNFLSRTMREKVKVKPIELNAWDSISPAILTNGASVPNNYLDILKIKGQK
jgi:bleomycin hydrolase